MIAIKKLFIVFGCIATIYPERNEALCPHTKFIEKHICEGEATKENALTCSQKIGNPLAKVHTVFFGKPGYKADGDKCVMVEGRAAFKCEKEPIQKCTLTGLVCKGEHDLKTGYYCENQKPACVKAVCPNPNEKFSKKHFSTKPATKQNAMVFSSTNSNEGIVRTVFFSGTVPTTKYVTVENQCVMQTGVPAYECNCIELGLSCKVKHHELTGQYLETDIKCLV